MAGDTQIASDLISWAVGLPSIGVVAAYGLSMIRRRMSSDQKKIKEDSSYTDLIETYKKERDEIKIDRERVIARMAIIEAERNDAVGKVGKLTAEVEFLSEQVKALKVLVERLGNSLDEARSEMQKITIDNVKLTSQIQNLQGEIARDKEGK